MGWEIVNTENLRREIIGRAITRNPNDPEQYEVRSIKSNGYITAVMVTDMAKLKMIPEEKLIKEKWWIK